MTKKISALLCAAVLIISFSATIFGALETTHIGGDNNGEIILVDKQKNEMKAKFQAAQQKWNTMNELQKEEIYRLKEVTIDIECQIIDKYIEFGIIDAETGAGIKSKKIEYKSEMRKSDKIPGFGIKHNGSKKK